MPLNIAINRGQVQLNRLEQTRIQRQLHGLERRLVHHPEPTATLSLRQHPGQRRIQANLRLQLGPLGPSLVSHQRAETADQAVRLAVDDVERQLERRLSQQRGEPTFGVPSRRWAPGRSSQTGEANEGS